MDDDRLLCDLKRIDFQQRADFTNDLPTKEQYQDIKKLNSNPN